MLRFVWPLALLLALLAVPGCVFYGDDDTDPEQNDSAVVGAGWQFGECGGYCQGTLSINLGAATLEVLSWNDAEPALVSTGTLSAAARTELATISADLESQALAETYGCPDCDDGGAAWIDYLRGDIVSRSTYEYSIPPFALSAADTFAADVMSALRDCASSSRITVESCGAL
jgi:hypothetical protein